MRSWKRSRFCLLNAHPRNSLDCNGRQRGHLGGWGIYRHRYPRLPVAAGLRSGGLLLGGLRLGGLGSGGLGSGGLGSRGLGYSGSLIRDPQFKLVGMAAVVRRAASTRPSERLLLLWRQYNHGTPSGPLPRTGVLKGAINTKDYKGGRRLARR